jgi:hypothetical protein
MFLTEIGHKIPQDVGYRQGAIEKFTKSKEKPCFLPKNVIFFQIPPKISKFAS